MELSSAHTIFTKISFFPPWMLAALLFLTQMVQCLTRAPWGRLDVAELEGRTRTKGSREISADPVTQSFSGKYMWGWSTKRQGRKVKGNHGVLYEISELNSRQGRKTKWVLINDRKCSAESSFTRLNRVRIPRTEAGEQGISFVQISWMVAWGEK